MSAFSQFYILSLRGDVLVLRDLRGELPSTTPQTFYRKSKLPIKGPQFVPVMHQDGIQFISIREAGMYFVFTSITNVSPGVGMEMLRRIAEVIRDYCGVLTEEAIRKNFVLVYELIDEMLDFGFPQTTDISELKGFVRSVPVLVDTESRSELLGKLVASKTTSSKTANQSVAISRKNQSSEIFVDLLEHITVLYSRTGELIHSEIEGALVIKSFIKGHPRVCIGLSSDLRVGRAVDGNSDDQPSYSSCVLDQATFHDCCNFQEWDMDRTLMFEPPEGEFSLLRYRTKDEFVPPFRVFTYVEEMGEGQLDLVIRLQTTFPDTTNANRLRITCPVPTDTVSASCELEDPNKQSAEYIPRNKQIVWNVGKIKGGKDTSIRMKMNIENRGGSLGNYKREVGPVSLNFEIPMYVCSSVQILYLKVFEGSKQLNPHRWVRSISKTDSYQVRVDASGENKTPNFY